MLAVFVTIGMNMNMFNATNNENVHNLFGDYSNFNVFPLEKDNNAKDSGYDDITVDTANSCQSAQTPSFGNCNHVINMNHSHHCNHHLHANEDDDMPPLPTLHQLMTLCQALTSDEDGGNQQQIDLNILYVSVFFFKFVFL